MTERLTAWDILGIAPDWTSGACSVDYVRYQRGANERDEFEHEECWRLLAGGGDE
jgi:hypothetical protein